MGEGHSSDGHRLLGVYVNDHRAAATGGQALARRLRDSNRGDELGDVLVEVVAEIERDAATLDEVAAALGLKRSRVKEMLALVAERVGRLKMNGRMRGYSPLSRVLELDMLLAGIDSKRTLWRALASCQGAHPEIAHFDFGVLVEGAHDQRDRLEPHLRHSAQRAFGATASSPQHR